MKAITDALAEQALIQGAINRHGFFAEHNFWHYFCKQNRGRKCVFLCQSGNGIMAHKTGKGVWHLFAEPLAPKDERLNMLKLFVRYAYDQGGANKVMAELTENTHAEALAWLKHSKDYRAGTYAEILEWPLFNMRSWDATLAGKHWKKVRNTVHRIERSHEIAVVPAEKVPKKQLRGLIAKWLRARNDNDRVDSRYYHNLVENRFRGFDMTRVVLADNRPAALTGGWKIPNSDNYYSSLGLIDYTIEGMGEYSNIDDLRALKAMGFETVDFGGSDGKLLEFKQKFRPESSYRTYRFSILRK